MGHDFKFITSTAAYDSFPQGKCIPIEFIALLTSISFRDTHFLLELQNFANGEPDTIPYVVRMRCNNDDSKKLAKMTITLLFQLFGIDTPERILDGSFQPENLHWENLTFVNCKCLYRSSDMRYSVVLDDIKPLKTSAVLDAALNQRRTLQGQVIFQIFQNLLLMDQKPSQFKFARLNSYNIDFVKSIEKIKALGKESTKAAASSNPLFVASHLRSPVESQNEFDSQLMGNGGSLDTLGFDPIEESQSSVDSCPSQQPTKRLKPSSSTLQPNASAAVALGSKLKLVGRMVGMFPYSDVKSPLQIYFVPCDWPSLEDTNLVPDVNCLELIVEAGSRLHELFTEVHKRPARFTDILKQESLPIEIVRTKWKLRDELHSSYWALRHIEQEQEMLTRIQRLPAPSSRSPRDPFVLFKELVLDKAGDASYVRMIALLVSCTFEPSDYVGMIFTDFTQNPNMNQKTPLDPYLIDFDNRLQEHEGIRVFFYRNNFGEFDRKLKRIYGYSLENMFQPKEPGVKAGNVTHKGIVCKLLLKVRRYDGKLNAIVRACEPLTTDYNLRYEDERTHLNRFFRVALERLNWDSISRFKGSYAKCFPPLPDCIEELSGPQPLPNVLQIDNIADYEVETASDIAQLNQVQHETRTLYCVEGQVLALQHGDSDAFLEILITNDVISTNYVDPTRILRIAIPGGDSLRFFFSASDTSHQHIRNLHNLVVGEELCFRILRRAMRITGFQDKIAMAMIWCPMECTLEELRSQTIHSSQRKLEEQDSVEAFQVKTETG
ncbi:hypothetical protein HG536_0D00720 [Torulaspora globosa]|uniref:Telomeric single stranded DNA binding POT1/Cdc13 domain-containing protein n=1 Tax=Torulaspora globosa TaxID=48254 RepID=A0A7G3ZGB4_9SACH|nr:uncharacterized protein HG536_0D00720 [Torulaspora globosa]QLL32550.1 hypothetical protein HG536_0D00720 [Torulaspora globosa]